MIFKTSAKNIVRNRPASRKSLLTMRTSLSLALVIPLIALYGCAKNPAEDVPKADVSSATSASTTPAAAGKTFAFSPGSSSIDFVGSKVTGRHNGGFRKFAGELRVENVKIADTGNK